jgi:D-mannonate dehydratase
MRAFRDIGFTGPVRPDHVPTLDGETNEHPGYEMLGRLWALGYIKVRWRLYFAALCPLRYCTAAAAQLPCT